ncbi:MAG: hypothetical protein JWM98_1618 [Thermoleophilia bacterium]|nr:hypothetical protein [Thermoleophilia bacterium]
MSHDPLPDEPDNVLPDAVTANLDPGSLKDAHGRTGRMMQSAGLPFEADEFEGDGEDADSSSSSSSSDA